MANEFVARRGIIAQTGGAKITGSLLVSGAIDATGYAVNATSFTGSFSGSVTSASNVQWDNVNNKPSGIVSSSVISSPSQGTVRLALNGTNTDADTGLQVGDAPTFTGLTVTSTPALAGIPSSSAQVAILLPGGSVSSSLQYPGWVTASSQVDITATAGYSAFSSSIATKNALQDVSIGALNAATSSYAINSTIQGQLAGVVSGSAQVKALLPTDTVSSSAQFPGWVTASSQVALVNVAGTTFSASNFTFPQNLTVGGTLTAERIQTEYITSSIIFESGSTKFGDTSDDTHAFTGSVLIAGPVSASAGFTGSFKGDGSQLTGLATTLRVTGSNASTDTINLVTDGITFAGGNGITTAVANDILTISAPAGTVSGSAQVQILLPGGSVSSSAQVDYNSITNKLSGVVSASAQVAPLLPGGTVSASAQLPPLLPAGTVSSSTQLPAGTVSSSAQFPGWVTASSQIALTGITGTTFAASNFTFPQNLTVGGTLTAEVIQTEYITSSIIFESGSTKFGDTSDDTHQFTGSLSVLGSISGALVLPAGVVTASSQIDYNSITNKLSGVVSSSAQFTTLANPFTGSFTGSFKGDGSGLTGVSAAGTVSSSAQIAALLPASTVSSSIQIDYNSITNKLSGVVSSSAQVAPLLPASTVSSSAQVIAAMPGAISSSTQFQTLANPFTGSFTGSFVGSGASLTGLNIASALNVDVYKFVGDASTTLFTVSSSYFVSSVFVSVDGLSLINTEDYSISGAGITFVTAPPSASNIVVRALINAQSSGTGSFTGSFTGDGSGLTGVSAAGTVSSSAQIAALLPASTVSSSAQVDYNSITNKLSGVVSSSAQVAPLLPGGTVSASAQLPPLLPAGTVSSSTQLPAGTVSSSAQFPGWVTASSQVALTGITGTTFAASNFTFPQNLTVGGTLTAEVIQTEYITSSIIFESGSTKFGDTSDDTHQFTGSVSIAGPVSASAGFTGSFKGDGSQLTGLATTLRVTGSNASTDTINLVTDGITFAGGNGITTSITSDILTISAPAGTVTASSQIALNGINGTTFASSNFTFPQQLIVTGIFSGSTSAIINNSVYSGSLVTGIVGPVSNQVVASIAAASCDGVFFDYVVKDGTNYRTGTVMVTSNGTTVEYTDTSTADIGNTAQAIFVVDIASSIIRLKFTNTSGTWVVKTTIRAL